MFGSNWRRWSITKQFLDSSLYTPYLWGRVRGNELSLPLRAKLKPCKQRRFHAYCVGAAKTGTTSLAHLLSQSYRAAHEPFPHDSVVRTYLLRRARYSTRKFANYIRFRDRLLSLEFEASLFLVDWISFLVEIFPDAKFILTIRDCKSWLESMANQEWATNTGHQRSYWKLLTDDYFGGEQSSSEGDALLLKQNLPPVVAYLKHWTYHNQKILDTVPDDRLLVIKTDEIGLRLGRIADFLGIPVSTLNADATHRNKTHRRRVCLDSIPEAHIRECANSHCRELMMRFFPEVDIDP